MTKIPWTEEAIRALGARTDLVTAGSIFMMGRDKSRQLARAGTFPCAVIRTGSTWVVPVASILRALGLEDDEGGLRGAALSVLNDPAEDRRGQRTA
jgi:hypothetical protein